MVKVRKQTPTTDQGHIDIQQWQAHVFPDSKLIQSALHLSELASSDVLTPLGHNCFAQSLEMAEKVAELELGEDAVAATLVYSAVEYADLNRSDIKDQLGQAVYDIVKGVQQLHGISEIPGDHKNAHHHIDNLRKMLLSMVRDVRVVVIKLAERVVIMRNIDQVIASKQLHVAEKTALIYAPLASRLGIHEIKWELEDLSFALLEPKQYIAIAKQLNERRIDREARIHLILSTINNALKKENIKGEAHGRAKHIYSIYRKMQRKKVDFDNIFDATAVRVLVPTVDDCYTVLSIAHEAWQPIPKEFDDYISTPKPNGYQSIHTAVIDNNDRHFEIQVRTYQMHEESEIGVAAHWLYKEGGEASGYEEKIKWLRQLLDWQKELSKDKNMPKELEKSVFEDRIYVFTPEGQIIDLPQGATPLDFAYHVHTEIGHRCRGAKVGGKITPLTKPLAMGVTVDIMTTKTSKPSRDWLIPRNGYLKTSKSRAKVLSWFKKQDVERHIHEGRELFAREIKHLHIDDIKLDHLAHSLKYRDADYMFAALGNGELSAPHLVNVIQANLKINQPKSEKITTHSKPAHKKEKGDINIQGVGSLLTTIANCCKPIPGDDIIGYITQGTGVSIHKKTCNNLTYLNEHFENRIIEASWEENTSQSYIITLEITAIDRHGLINDVTHILAQDKVNIHNLNLSRDPKEDTGTILVDVEISDLNTLSKIIKHIMQLPNVLSIKRNK